MYTQLQTSNTRGVATAPAFFSKRAHPERVADLAIVIVNYNVERLLERCLETIFASVGDFSASVCVVDNASKDDSVEMVRRLFPDVDVIANSDNPGFSAGNNQGMALSGIGRTPPRYVLLLNPDTELLPTTLRDSLTFMDDNTSVGVMGPKLLLPNGTLDLAARRSFPTPVVSFYRMTGLSQLFPKSRVFGRYNLTYLDIDQQADVDSVVGAYMLVRSAAIEQVGLLDERFWMYGEDLDWALRIKTAGWRVVYNPAVVAFHVKRASSQQNHSTHPAFYRAMLIFYYKHFRQQTSLPMHLFVIAGIAVKGGPKIWPDIRSGSAILHHTG